MHFPHFLLDLALTLAAAAGVVLAFRAIRLPPVVGLLLTGVLLGPSGLRLVAAGEEAQVFAEIGVVALLFLLGLEFSRDTVRRVRRSFLLAGPVQVGTTALAAGWFAHWAGLPAATAVFVGLMVALSSTAVVLRTLAQRRETTAPHGRIALGVLLFQDVMLAPILAVTPVLAGTAEGTPAEVALRLGGSLAVLAVAYLVARFVIPPFLGRLIGARLDDIFILAAVAVCLGAAFLTGELGFSPALGAFLAGVLLAESDFAHQVAAEVAPFRDVFTNFFFVSVGLLVDVGAFLDHLPTVLAVAGGVVLLKALTATLGALAGGSSAGPAVTAGLSLAQVGEFSFVLATVGRAAGLLGDELYQIALAVTAVTLLLTPALVALAPHLARAVAGTGGRPAIDEGLSGHVVLGGYGLNGRNLCRVLGEAGVPWVAVDLDRPLVQEMQREGRPVVLGDASRREMLEHLRIGEARVAVFALSDPGALRRAVTTARHLAPDLHIIVRTPGVDDVEELDRLGADEVIAEELETSIELVTRVLRRYHVPRNVVDAEVRVLRAGHYEMLRSPGTQGAVTRTVLAALERGTTEIYRLAAGDRAVGRSLADLDLRRATGAVVVAVVRGEEPRTSPPPDLVLEVGDDLVLVGGHAEIEAAFRLLGGPPPAG